MCYSNGENPKNGGRAPGGRVKLPFFEWHFIFVEWTCYNLCNNHALRYHLGKEEDFDPFVNNNCAALKV